MTTAVATKDINDFSMLDVAALLNCNFTLTGSRAICPQAASTASDWDWIGLVENLPVAALLLIEDKWETGTSFPEDASKLTGVQFISMKKGKMNLLITADANFHKAFLLATRVATQLGLTSKNHRIQLFQAILYGNG